MRILRDEAKTRLGERISGGRDLLARPADSQSEFEALRADYYSWTEYNEDLLEALFTDRRARDEYHGMLIGFFGDQTFSQKVAELRDDIATKVRRLESLLQRLDLAEEPTSSAGRQAIRPSATTSAKVFLVHGHDDATKQTVARFIERLGLDVVILHEQANKGRTVIEKFEDHTDVGYAVVLLTPDDVGGAAVDPVAAARRARQNVVFELGFFYGSLGRERVSALLRGPIERPTDVAGVVYIDMADSSWPLQLAKELKAAGLPVDMNRVV